MIRLFLLLFAVCFTMCKPKTQNENAIKVDLDRPEKASLFDYFKSIELIPLETSSDCLISAIDKIITYQGRYYMFDPLQQIIFVHDSSGNFIFKIDKKGHGAGEYVSIVDFNINPYSGNLELLEPYGKLHFYDLLGNYLETEKIVYPGFKVAHTIASVDPQTYVLHSVFEPKKIAYYNLNEHMLKNEEFEEDYDLGRFSNKPYKYSEDCFFYRPIHPVVYKMGKEKLEVAFQFDFGRYANDGRSAIFSKESKRDFPRLVDELFDQFSYLIHAVRHNNRYIFASLSWKDKEDRSNIIVDKMTGESKFISGFIENVVFNSYRGEEIHVTDEYVLMPSQWVDLEKRISKEMLDEKQQKIFGELLQAEMELNPVLIKYWFK